MTLTADRTVSAPPADRRRSWLYAGGAGAGAFTVLVVVLVTGGGAPQRAPVGLPDPGPLTGWGLPLVRLTADIAGVATVGLLLAAALLLPTQGGALMASATRCCRSAARVAALWAVAAAVEVVLAFADFLGVPPDQALGRRLGSYIDLTTQGRTLSTQVALAAVVAVGAWLAVRTRGAILVLLVALAAVVAPALAGHSATEDNHMLATSSLVVHVLAAALWVGGLGALLLVGRQHSAPLRIAVPRFSRLAAWCIVAITASGAVNAGTRLPDVAALATSAYGRLVLAKATAVVVLATLGWAHRRGSLPALAASRPGAFVRLAAVEVAIMAATIGLAVGLSRTPRPGVEGPLPLATSPARAVLGYDLPPPPTPWRLLVDVRPDGFLITLVALAAALYLTGVRALHRRQVRWPAGRTTAFCSGLVVITVATSGGLGTYAAVLFSAHMAQHMVLNMVAPLLLVLGAPMTLALRALPAAPVSGDRGPRQVLAGLLHSRFVAFLSHPLVASVIFVSSLYGLYFTPVFGAAMSSHWGHLAMQLHFLLAGSLFFWVLIGVDPGPRRPPHIVRLGLLFLVMAAHAFFGVTIMSGTSVLARGYFAGLQRPWGSLLRDQQLGGAIGWAFGEVPTIMVITVLCVQWLRADERAARSADRAADRAERRPVEAGPSASAATGAPVGREPARPRPGDDLAGYNAWLARLHDQELHRRELHRGERSRRTPGRQAADGPERRG